MAAAAFQAVPQERGLEQAFPTTDLEIRVIIHLDPVQAEAVQRDPVIVDIQIPASRCPKLICKDWEQMLEWGQTRSKTGWEIL